MREMPKFTKSSPEIVAGFDAAMDRLGAPDVTQRKVFGYPCAWIAGNMTTGLFGEEWWVRVSEPERDQLLEMGGHPFAPMPGKSAMGRYVVMPESVIADEAALDGWLTRAIEFTRSLPPKK